MRIDEGGVDLNRGCLECIVDIGVKEFDMFIFEYYLMNLHVTEYKDESVLGLMDVHHKRLGYILAVLDILLLVVYVLLT